MANALGYGRHIHYIQRDGVDREGLGGELYGREGERVDGRDFAERSQDDRHQFRIIVSPEDAGEIGDLKATTRRLMDEMERDLGTRLDWVAVDHHNTGHPHTHIVIRGKDAMGQDLVIARDYLMKGLRARAEEARKRLRVSELRRAAAGETNRSGRAYSALETGERFEGVFERTVDLAQGRMAIIGNEKAFAMVPWRPDLERQRGRSLIIKARERGVGWMLPGGRQRGLGR